jgi:Fe-S-cluster containining protein
MPRKNTAKKKTEKAKKKGGKAEEKKPPKFQFECQLCGACCKNEEINITLADIDKWILDNTIFRVFHLLRLDDTYETPKLILKKDEDGYCNLYHRDNNKCTIYDSRPLFCRAYPLSFNGEHYLIRSKDCIGLNKGTMTKEKLDEIRNNAHDEFIAKQQSDRVMPTVHRIIINSIIERSQAFMDKLSDDQKDEINKEDLSDEDATDTQEKAAE